MRILVTGCAGYIGSVLVGQLLAEGHEVTGIDNLMYENGGAILGYFGDPGFQFVRGDVRHMPWYRFRSHDVVIPLAALVGAPACQKHQAFATQVNRDHVADVVKSLSPSQRVIYPNTNSGYGKSEGGFSRECDELKPVSHYGVTKCEAEEAVRAHDNSVVLRLATVYGTSPRMRFDLMVNDFVEQISTAGGLVVYEPEFRRNFVGIKDVCRAFLFMINTSSVGVFNLGNPEANLTKLQLAHMACDLLSVSRKRVSIGEGRDPDQRDYAVSNDKILATGFEFKHGLPDGIMEVANAVDALTGTARGKMRNA